MIERKNIDRVFQENLKDLDINPSKNVWNNIELLLTDSPKKRAFVPKKSSMKLKRLRGGLIFRSLPWGTAISWIAKGVAGTVP